MSVKKYLCGCTLKFGVCVYRLVSLLSFSILPYSFAASVRMLNLIRLDGHGWDWVGGLLVDGRGRFWMHVRVMNREMVDSWVGGKVGKVRKTIHQLKHVRSCVSTFFFPSHAFLPR